MLKMNLKEKIKILLDQIKLLKGVENAVLSQRDGNPIQSSGVWFSKDEIFNVCSATSAIFNVGTHLHPNDLKYILIEGNKGKILIAPLINSIHQSLNKILEQQMNIKENNNEFFIAITAQPNVNLGGIFLQTNECLKKIKTSLITSGESFKPPLIQFSDQKIQNIIQGFNLKDNEEINLKISPFTLSFSENVALELNNVLKDFYLMIPELNFAFITIEGGFIASKMLKNNNITNNRLDKISAMSYSVFQTANRCSWLLKKMSTENILFESENSFQFINGLGKAIFSTEIEKSKQKLGLLRLIMPQFLKKINDLIKKASEIQDFKNIDIKKLLGNLIIK